MDISTKQNCSVSFFTICYEGDWERILIGDRLETMVKRCGIDFFEKVLIITNVNDREKVEKFAILAVENKVIDAYYFSEDYSDEILKAFSIQRKSFVLDFYDGYCYSMGPLTAVYQCKSDYLLFFTGDCMVEPDKSSYWITEGIKLLESDKKILIANPLWAYNQGEVSNESFKEDKDWYYGYGFSDQCFLVEVKRLQGNVYNYYHVESERYPVYGGNLFEKRIDNFMRSQELGRITKKDVCFIHEKLMNEGVSQEVKKVPVKKKIKQIASVYLRKIRKRVNRILKKGK